MAKKPIPSLRFQRLSLSEFLELLRLLFDHALPPALALLLGISKAYNEAKDSVDRLVEIFRRNPALLQTEKLVKIIAEVRRRMIALKVMLKGMLTYVGGERLDSLKAIENAAHPYLKDASRDTQTALVANAIEMTDALRTPANLPLLTQLELKTIVDEIATMAREAEKMLYARGEELAFRKDSGSATETRLKLEKQLRFLLSTIIPAHYSEATGALLVSFEHAIVDINGVLDSFRHLTDSGGNNDWGGEGDPGNGNEEENEPEENEPGGSEPDTQPANPPSGGGGFTDPDA
ncbi:MAG: DUF6261 family protein [Mediterranea sp.]|jgi:hypothetical protein|nr:DUF6261 family protein [Mediterranea sp.]